MSAHARQQALLRGIKQSDIERIINEPIQTIKANYEERYKSFGIVYDTYTKKSHYIIIIHNALNKHVHIITVMYTDKGGVRASGFDKL